MKLNFTLAFLLLSFLGRTQSAFLPYDRDVYHQIDRLEIKNGGNGLMTAYKPYSSENLAEFITSIEQDSSSKINSIDQFNMLVLKENYWEEYNDTTLGDSKKPIVKKFYRKKSDLYHVQEDNFDLHINPVLYLSGGRDFNDGEKVFYNTRGLELRGKIDDKVAFYTYLADNQVFFPNYVDNQVHRNNASAVPGENFWKEFKGDGYDFLTARGYVSFNLTKHINATLGHDKNFIGNGYRSLILSDYSGNYPFLRLQAKIWKIKYTLLYSTMASNIYANAKGVPMSSAYPQKFQALHHLSIDITKNFNVGLFEAITNSNGDSATNAPFNFNYLNPIIFYRSVEQNLGSNGNAILGLDFKWNLFRRFSLYGQLVLDEFKFDQIMDDQGWWANKYGWQAGLKYIDIFGLNNVDLQVEFNTVRPYTYSHTNRSTSYSNYNQPLAHPYGANFREILAILRVQPINRLYLTGKIIYAEVGYDTTGTNFGQDILKPNVTRQNEYGNQIGQGFKSKIAYLNLTASYLLKNNLFIDFTGVIRKEVNDVEYFNTETTMATLGLRWNIGQRLADF